MGSTETAQLSTHTKQHHSWTFIDPLNRRRHKRAYLRWDRVKISSSTKTKHTSHRNTQLSHQHCEEGSAAATAIAIIKYPTPMTSKSRMDATTASSPSQTSANLGDDRKKLPRRLKHVSPSEKEEQQLPFPQKLYMMLESVDRLGLTHTASWLPGGRSFIVKDPIQFMDLTVPHFFKATKFRSSQRQLNLWGFHR